MSEIVRRLACYLRANPLAGDTKEGIALWWLGPGIVSIDKVERALAWLEADGLVEGIRQADGLVHYRRRSRDVSTDAKLDRLIDDIAAPGKA